MVCIKHILHSASDMIQSNYSEPNCKLQVVQKDLRIVVNMSDSCDQPLHVGAAVNEVSRSRLRPGLTTVLISPFDGVICVYM